MTDKEKNDAREPKDARETIPRCDGCHGAIRGEPQSVMRWMLCQDGRGALSGLRKRPRLACLRKLRAEVHKKGSRTTQAVAELDRMIALRS